MTCACNRIGSLFLEGIMKVHRILLLAALLVGVALVSTVSAQSFSTYTNSDGSIFTQGTSLEGTVFLPGNTVNLPGYTTLPTATVSYGLSAVKVDPFLTPQYSNAVNNVWGSTNTANFAVYAEHSLDDLSIDGQQPVFQQWHRGRQCPQRQ